MPACLFIPGAAHSLNKIHHFSISTLDFFFFFFFIDVVVVVVFAFVSTTGTGQVMPNWWWRQPQQNIINLHLFRDSYTLEIYCLFLPALFNFRFEFPISFHLCFCLLVVVFSHSIFFLNFVWLDSVCAANVFLEEEIFIYHLLFSLNWTLKSEQQLAILATILNLANKLERK